MQGTTNGWISEENGIVQQIWKWLKAENNRRF